MRSHHCLTSSTTCWNSTRRSKSCPSCRIEISSQTAMISLVTGRIWLNGHDQKRLSTKSVFTSYDSPTCRSYTGLRLFRHNQIISNRLRYSLTPCSLLGTSFLLDVQREWMDTMATQPNCRIRHRQPAPELHNDDNRLSSRLA